MSLHDICQMLVAELYRNNLGDHYDANELSNELIFIHKNKRISNNELLASKYLIFDYIGHLPEVRLTSFENLPDLEAHIIGDSGIFNGFSTIVIAIIDGLVKPYKIGYVNSETKLKGILDLNQINLLKDEFGFNKIPFLSEKQLIWQ